MISSTTTGAGFLFEEMKKRIAELEAENARLRTLVERGAELPFIHRIHESFTKDCQKELQNNVRNHQVSDKGNS